MLSKDGNPRTPTKTPRERFRGLIQKRLDKATHGLKILGNCGNASGYEYTAEEARQIIETVGEAYEGMILKFQPLATEPKTVLAFSDDVPQPAVRGYPGSV